MEFPRERSQNTLLRADFPSVSAHRSRQQTPRRSKSERGAHRPHLLQSPYRFPFFFLRAEPDTKVGHLIFHPLIHTDRIGRKKVTYFCRIHNMLKKQAPCPLSDGQRAGLFGIRKSDTAFSARPASGRSSDAVSFPTAQRK